jgi:tetratricopeptide (TPR) repeat protein
MQCPRCGSRDFDDGEPCASCGFTKNKYPYKIISIGVFALLLLASSLIYYAQNNPHESDIMLQAAEKEMEKGISILQEIENDLDSLRDVHHETMNQAMKEREFASRSSEKVVSAIPRLEEAAFSFQRAENFYKKCQSIHLSTQQEKYLHLELQRVSTYQGYVSTLTELCGNYATYYQFSIFYLTGEQVLITILSDIDRGNDRLESEDYTLAAAAYESALRKLAVVDQEFTQAYAVLQLQYVGEFLSNMEHLEQALHNLKDAAQSLEKGNVVVANFLASQGLEAVQRFSKINQSAFQTQMAVWYQSHVTDLLKKKNGLLKKIESIEEDIAKGRW